MGYEAPMTRQEVDRWTTIWSRRYGEAIDKMIGRALAEKKELGDLAFVIVECVCEREHCAPMMFGGMKRAMLGTAGVRSRFSEQELREIIESKDGYVIVIGREACGLLMLLDARAIGVGAFTGPGGDA